MQPPKSTIRLAVSASQINQGQVSFRPDDYAALIDSKGYDVIIENAVRCPCTGETGSPLSDCQNCLGTGYFFINPLKTKALMTGINRDTKYKDWSFELMGTISITVRDDSVENLAYNDKITLLNKYGRHSESLEIRTTSTNQKFVFTIYKPNQIIDVWVYIGSKTKLRKLDVSEYSISSTNPYAINLNFNPAVTNSNGYVTIRYKHQIQYNIIDLPHELRASWEQNREGAYSLLSLPMNAVAKRSHFLVDEKLKYSGTGVQNNSYLP